jgi:hypothetical protein
MGKRATQDDDASGREDRAARLAALGRLLDYAEREARSLNARDCTNCLQLARAALLHGPEGGGPLHG